VEINFSKYQGAGNDFIMINGFEYDEYKSLTQHQIEILCDRRFGIGADGLIVIKPTPKYDFEMLYYNADGFPGSMCGNGGRCSFRFARDIQIVGEKADFKASDGPHSAFLNNDGLISLQMKDVDVIKEIDHNVFELNTGSPHIVKIVSNLDEVDVIAEGRAIRNSMAYIKEGINVNFMQLFSDHTKVATYERGVEDETFSCGTGVTASALVAIDKGYFSEKVEVRTKGGVLNVMAMKDKSGKMSNIWLTGPAVFVFEGCLEI